ncbi:MAG: hypothetical protein OER97_03870 [Gammaproteobacteria bacterium]|nr:hypothetical protein [Gammaproteobacteria bacterium]
MRVLVLLGALFLGGCGSFVTMEELEQQAALTGDWSAVEQRERIIARRKAKKGPTCASGQIAYCQSYVGRMQCQCVSQGAIRDVLAWHD